MTIQFVRAAHGGGTAASATTLMIPFDATGCDALVVGIRDILVAVVTGVTYNGVALTLARHDGASGVSSGTTMYVGTGPASGINNVIISFSTSTNIGAIVSGFSGVNQASPVGNVAGHAATAGSPFSQSIAVTAGNVAVDMYVVAKADTTSAPVPSAPSTQADKFLAVDNSFYAGMSYAQAPTAMAWTLTGPSIVPQSQSVIELKASAVADAIPPTAASASVANATPTFVDITMSEAMDTATTPAASSVTVSGHAVTALSWQSATVLRATVSAAFVNGEAARTVAYTQPGINNARDVATTPNLLANFSGLAIANNVGAADNAAPIFSSAQVANAQPSVILVTMNEALAASVPSNSAFTPSGGRTVTGVTVTGVVASVTVNTPYASGDEISIAYTQPGANPRLQDAAGNATATFAAQPVTNNVAAGLTVSPYFLSIRGQSNNYADRVRDTTTSAGNGPVTLANLTQLGLRTFAGVYAVGKSGIPYCIEDMTTGDWETGLGTLTGTTIFTRDIVTESSNGNARVNFAAGTKNIYVTLTAAAIKRMAVKSYIDLRDYPVDPTFTTDSTAGIQAAINDAFISGVQTIRAQEGRYKIAGPVRTVDDFGRGCNGQIVIPASDLAASMKSIRIIGEGATNWIYGAISDVPVVNNGVIFESTLTVTSGSNPAVITSAAGFTFTWGVLSFTDFSLENVCIRTNTAGGANKMGGLDLYNLANGGFLNNVRVDVNRGMRTNPVPTAVNSTGIRTSKRDNSGAFKWGQVFVGGYNNGVSFSEHMSIDRLTIYGCINAVTLEPAFHSSWIGMLNVECCKNSIVINGDHALGIGTYDTEHDSFGNGFDFAYDIKYVAGSGGRKVCILSSTVVVGSVGISDAGWATNATAANYKVVAGAGAN